MRALALRREARPCPRTTAAASRATRRVVPARGCSSRSSTTLPARDPAPGTRLRRSAPPSARSRSAAGSRPRTVEIGAREALDGGDQIRRDALRHHRVLLDQLRVVAVEPAAVGAHRHARHRLDAAADHEVLLPGHHAERREVHRLLAGAAEAVQRDAARSRGIPARGQHRLARDAGSLLVHVGDAARDHVLDVARIEAGARLERVQALREQVLRVHARERPGVLLALAARRANRVDDPGFAHLDRSSRRYDRGGLRPRAGARDGRRSGPTLSPGPSDRSAGSRARSQSFPRRANRASRVLTRFDAEGLINAPPLARRRTRGTRATLAPQCARETGVVLGPQSLGQSSTGAFHADHELPTSAPPDSPRPALAAGTAALVWLPASADEALTANSVCEAQELKARIGGGAGARHRDPAGVRQGVADARRLPLARRRLGRCRAGPAAADPVQPQAPRRQVRDRLPVLPLRHRSLARGGRSLGRALHGLPRAVPGGVRPARGHPDPEAALGARSSRSRGCRSTGSPST